MDPEVAATGRGRAGTEAVPWPYVEWPASGHRGPGPMAAVQRRLLSVPRAWRFTAFGVLALLAAAAVGYTTSRNPTALEPDFAVLVRVLVILAFSAAGIYAHTSRVQARMGSLLLGAAVFSCIWLLNGSANALLFSLAAPLSGAASVMLAYLLLSQPNGRLHARIEHRFLWRLGAPLALLWAILYEVSGQPPFRTPLLRCAPHCPHNVFGASGSGGSGAVIAALFIGSWLVFSVGPPLLLLRRSRGASAPMRRSLVPVLGVSVALAAVAGLYLVFMVAAPRPGAIVGAAYICVAAAVPVAILAGLSLERLYMGQALVEFVNQLARDRGADPQPLLAASLNDPTLRVAYRRPGRGTYVDFAGRPFREGGTNQALVSLESDGRQVAVVLYDAELDDQRSFLEAAGTAAVFRLEQAQLEADLRASTSELAASRVRMMEAADEERRRLERDLHDGVQQHLVGVRIKLGMAAEAMEADPVHGRQVLDSVGREMDDVLHELRAMAHGIYPALLRERGLGEALRSAAREAPTAVGCRAMSIGRYSEEVEVAVYFCCLEALQNAVKHAGPDAETMITLWQEGARLNLEVRDSGQGFDSKQSSDGAGLANMRDRIHTVQGTITIDSSPGHGTSVRGSVPVPVSVDPAVRSS